MSCSNIISRFVILSNDFIIKCNYDPDQMHVTFFLFVKCYSMILSDSTGVIYYRIVSLFLSLSNVRN